ncbi:hypothetical protein ABPG75_002828 [Micractinium tetrahymenae]
MLWLARQCCWRNWRHPALWTLQITLDHRLSIHKSGQTSPYLITSPAAYRVSMAMRAAAFLLLDLAVSAQGRDLQQISGQILNGRDAERGRFNYIASLRFPYAKDTGVKVNKFVCQGVLIRADVVLTSAWCTVNSGMWPIVNPLGFLRDKRPAEVRNVVATVWNSGYTGADDDVQDDIALMLLDKPSSVTPVKIAAASRDPLARNDKLTIAGWGLTQDGPLATSKHLMYASQFLLKQQRCAEKWSSEDNPVQNGGWDTNKMVCGAYAGHNKALCWGDAGAPLLRRGANAAGDLIVGIGSQSACKGTSDDGFPGSSIYSNVAHYYGWIQNGIRILKSSTMQGYGAWKVARKADYPPNPTCKGISHRCSKSTPEECCSGNCFIWACRPSA